MRPADVLSKFDFRHYVSGFNAGGTRNECHKTPQQEHAQPLTTTTSRIVAGPAILEISLV